VLDASPRPARTQRTVTDVDALMAELEAVRESGYALIDQEVEIGLRSIAVPLKTMRGKTIAALNVGLAATAEPADILVERYLSSLLAVQADLAGMLT